MTSARPALSTPVNPGTKSDRATSVWAGLSHGEWLATLKRGDTVRVQNGHATMPAAMVTNETPCYVFVGKLKFWRRHGWQVARQGKRVYRMKLRLVRDEREFV